MTPRELEQAMISPGSVFESPEQVLDARGLSIDQKIEILLRWENAALHEDVAVEEGMPDGDSDLVRRILVALGTLNAPVDMEHTGPSKLHGITLRPRTRGGVRPVPALRERSSQHHPATEKGNRPMEHNLGGVDSWDSQS